MQGTTGWCTAEACSVRVLSPEWGVRPGLPPCPASDQVAVGARRADSPGLVTAGSHDLLPNVPGSGRFTSGPCNLLPTDDGGDALHPVRRTGCKWTSWTCSIAGRGCGCVRAARHSVGRGRRARPVVPALLPSRGPNGLPRMVAQSAKRWTVERPARRTGATRRGPRPPGATWGHTQARQADTSQRPGASRSGLLLSPRIGAGTPHEHARAPAGSSTATRR
jgi:hypothetical protein